MRAVNEPQGRFHERIQMLSVHCSFFLWSTKGTDTRWWCWNIKTNRIRLYQQFIVLVPHIKSTFTLLGKSNENYFLLPSDTNFTARIFLRQVSLMISWDSQNNFRRTRLYMLATWIIDDNTVYRAKSHGKKTKRNYS